MPHFYLKYVTWDYIFFIKELSVLSQEQMKEGLG